MIDNLNNQIAKVKEEVHLKKKWEAHLTELENRKHQLERDVIVYEKKWNKEKRDVEKLERVTLTNILASLSGSKYERLEKEKQEEVTARLKFESHRNELASIKTEIEEIRVYLSKLINPEEEYRKLIEKKEQLLKQSGSILDAEISEIDDKLSDYAILQKEINEAIRAGERAYNQIEQAISTLEDAKGWSTWDMFGGGLISTAIKHSKLNEAEDLINAAQDALRYFQMELKDVGQFYLDGGGLKLDGFMTFADYFFDGILVDWSIHGKINDSLESTEKTKYEVYEMIKMLEEKLEEAATTQEKLITERAKIIEKA